MWGPTNEVEKEFEVLEGTDKLTTPGLMGEVFNVKLGTSRLSPGMRISPVADPTQVLVVQAPHQENHYPVRYRQEDKNTYFDPEYLEPGTKFYMSGNHNYTEASIDHESTIRYKA